MARTDDLEKLANTEWYDPIATCLANFSSESLGKLDIFVGTDDSFQLAQELDEGEDTPAIGAKLTVTGTDAVVEWGDQRQEFTVRASDTGAIASIFRAFLDFAADAHRDFVIEADTSTEASPFTPFPVAAYIKEFGANAAALKTMQSLASGLGELSPKESVLTWTPAGELTCTLSLRGATMTIEPGGHVITIGHEKLSPLGLTPVRLPALSGDAVGAAWATALLLSDAIAEAGQPNLADEGIQGVATQWGQIPITYAGEVLEAKLFTEVPQSSTEPQPETYRFTGDDAASAKLFNEIRSLPHINQSTIHIGENGTTFAVQFRAGKAAPIIAIQRGIMQSHGGAIQLSNIPVNTPDKREAAANLVNVMVERTSQLGRNTAAAQNLLATNQDGANTTQTSSELPASSGLIGRSITIEGITCREQGVEMRPQQGDEGTVRLELYGDDIFLMSGEDKVEAQETLGGDFAKLSELWEQAQQLAAISDANPDQQEEAE